MPSAHRRYAGWTPARLRREAEKIGSATIALFEASMRAKPHPEQGFCSCLGILRLPSNMASTGSKPLAGAAMTSAREATALSPRSSSTGSTEPIRKRRSGTARRSGTPTSVANATTTDERNDDAHSSHTRTADRARVHRHGQGAGRTTTDRADLAALDFEERLGLLIDREAIERENKRLATRLKFTRLRESAVIEDVNLKVARGLDKALFAKLVAGDWIERHQNLLIIGQAGVGKSFVACALGHKACRDNRSVLYHRVQRLFDALLLARGDGRYGRLLKMLARASSQPRGSGARTDVLQPLRHVRRSLRDGSQCFAGGTCLDDRRSRAEP